MTPSSVFRRPIITDTRLYHNSTTKYGRSFLQPTLNLGLKVIFYKITGLPEPVVRHGDDSIIVKFVKTCTP